MSHSITLHIAGKQSNNISRIILHFSKMQWCMFCNILFFWCMVFFWHVKFYHIWHNSTFCICFIMQNCSHSIFLLRQNVIRKHKRGKEKIWKNRKFYFWSTTQCWSKLISALENLYLRLMEGVGAHLKRQRGPKILSLFSHEFTSPTIPEMDF